MKALNFNVILGNLSISIFNMLQVWSINKFGKCYILMHILIRSQINITKKQNKQFKKGPADIMPVS